jgi:hypothetical protein
VRGRRAAVGRRAWAVAALAAASAAAGCNILTPAAYLAFGQPKADARYELEDRATVVFVDDRDNAIPVNSSRVRQAIADKVSNDLLNEKVLKTVISARDAMTVARSQDRDGKLLSVEALGEAVGAQQVIYVEMMSFRGSMDNVKPQPAAAARIKVVDVGERRRIYPPPESESTWDEVMAVSQPLSQELYRTSQGRRQVEMMMADLLGDRIAKMFYKHVPDEIGTRLNPQ